MAAKRISPLMILPPVIFLTLAAMFIFGLNRDDPDALPSSLIGQQAPPLTGIQLGDEPLASDADIMAAGIKLVNFWASWCGPCRIEHPNLMELSSLGIPIIGLNYKDSPDNALNFIGQLGNPYSKSLAVEGRMALNWGVYGVPETYLIDSNGKILMRAAGPLTQRVIKEKLMPAIRAAK